MNILKVLRYYYTADKMNIVIGAISLTVTLMWIVLCPPNLVVTFFDQQTYLDQINCFSDEGNGWQKSNINIKNKELTVNFRDKFKFRRGRINCSLNSPDGWRWFGLQFSVKEF